MDEETRAQRLAEWLESPPGTDPPEDLDPEVLAAVYALLPERAPAPRVTLDDIFASVETGPFAVRTTEAARGFPDGEVGGEGKVLPFLGRGGDPPPQRPPRGPGA